ncbi:MAG: CheY-like receiver [Phenylobacterium sp.]|nr:CheY-like receiver [Phenylobacterium sp.]
MSQLSLSAESDPRVLVVEDEPHICELLSDMLRADGFLPECVQRDEEAYAALHRSGAFACMIVDVNLGTGTTGYDVARFARRIDPQLPVIFVSGQTSPASFRAHSVPGSLFLAKPFTAGELMERVRVLVGDNDG